jgi:hypothetical protein
MTHILSLLISEMNRPPNEAGQLNSIALGNGLDDRGFESPQGLGIFLFDTMSRPAPGPTQPPLQWVPGAVSPGINRPGREADHSPPSSTEVKRITGAIPPFPPYVFMAWCLVKHRDNFTFNFVTTSISVLGLILPPLQCVPWIMRPKPEAN